MTNGENKTKVVVVGLGYVGLTLAVALATSERWKIIGVERDSTLADTIRKHKSPFVDAGLEEAMNSSAVKENFRMINNLDELQPGEANIFILAIGTPFIPGSRDIDMETLNLAIHTLRSKCIGGEHIVLRSTVPIGTCRKLAVEWQSQDLPEVYFHFAPERTVEGVAFQELFKLPQIIGSVLNRQTDSVKILFSNLAPDIVVAKSAEDAEAAKLVSNVYRDYSFAFANHIYSEFAKIGLDAVEVINIANKKYVRGNIPKPGFVGGPCLSKDTDILDLSLGSTNSLIMKAREANERLANEVLVSCKHSIIGILGLAFKGSPETADLRSSFAKNIADVSNLLGAQSVLGWDPIVRDVPKDWNVKFTELDELLEKCDVLILQNNHKFFQSEEFKKLLKQSQKKSQILDLWNLLPKSEFMERLILRVETKNE